MSPGRSLSITPPHPRRLRGRYTQPQRRQSVGFLDAPVSGGQAGAENGQLTVMVGGDAEVFSRAHPSSTVTPRPSPILARRARANWPKWSTRSASRVSCRGCPKDCTSQSAPVSIRRSLIESISKGAAQSWQMENRWQTMVNDEFEFGFAVDWMRKDLGIALDEARETVRSSS